MVLKEHQQKPHPNDSKVDVVGGAGLQFRQGKKPKYIPYEMSDQVIDWKEMWFYVRNLSSCLPLRTPGPPVKRPNWNSRGGNVDQVNFLLGEIERVKADHRICGASEIAHWSMQRIQPLQQRIRLGFQYTGGADPSRYSRSKITEDDLKDQVMRLLKNVAGTANIAGTFSEGRRPRRYYFE